MKIGIFSDLHGNIEAWHTMLDGIFKDASQLLCAGDTFGTGLVDPSSPWYRPQQVREAILYAKIPVTMVRGNTDPKGIYPDSTTGEIFGKKFYLCHGQLVPTDTEKRALAAREQATFFIYGHTHDWRIEKQGDVFLINPGSPTAPLKDPKHDTVAIMTERTIEIIDIHSRDILASLNI